MWPGLEAKIFVVDYPASSSCNAGLVLTSYPRMLEQKRSYTVFLNSSDISGLSLVASGLGLSFLSASASLFGPVWPR